MVKAVVRSSKGCDVDAYRWGWGGDSAWRMIMSMSGGCNICVELGRDAHENESEGNGKSVGEDEGEGEGGAFGLSGDLPLSADGEIGGDVQGYGVA